MIILICFGKNLCMSKFKIINLIDKLFITICVFLLCFAWINFYIKNITLTFIVSLITCFSICFLLFYFSNKKQTKIKEAKATQEEIEKTFLSFKLLPNAKKEAIISTIYQTNTKTENGFLKKDDNLYYIENSIDLLDENKFFNIIAEARNFEFNNIYIICKESTKQLNLNILKNKKIYIISKTELFNLLKGNNIKLDIDNINLTPNKISLKELCLNLFAENKAKSYFICGLVLLFSSVILPYNFYYIIFGSMLMLFAIICKLLAKLNLR